MTQESDDPDDVFVGEIPYYAIYDGKISVYSKELQQTVKEFEQYLKKTNYYDISTTQLLKYENIIIIYTNLIQLAKLALIDKSIGNNDYVEETFNIKIELEEDNCYYNKLAMEVTDRLDIIKYEFKDIINDYYNEKENEEIKIK